MNGEPRSTEYARCSSRSQLAVSSSVATLAKTLRPSSSVTTQRWAGVWPPVVTGRQAAGTARSDLIARATLAASCAVGSIDAEAYPPRVETERVCEDRPAMGEFVRIERDRSVATIRLDRPPANALARSVSEELRAAASEVGADPAIRAVVVWGGERIFAAGADIKAMVDFGPEEIAPDVHELEQACRDLEAIPKPVIAAVNGFALGGGCEVALACDFRFAAEDAELGFPEITLGIIPGAGGTQRLPRVVGLTNARDLIWSGRRVGANEGLAMGLVDRVVASQEVYPVAVEEAHLLAEGPTAAYAAAKGALAASDRPLAEGLEVERDVFAPLFATRDQEEGMRAFLEKRQPRFEGS